MTMASAIKFNFQIDEYSNSRELEESKSNHEEDKVRLRAILEETQCPLIPAKYDKNGKLSSAFYFDGNLWETVGDDSCRIIEFENAEMKRKAMDEVELIMAMDKYLSQIQINKSIDMYHNLLNAYREAKTSFNDGDSSNDEYQKLIPTNMCMCYYSYFRYILRSILRLSISS